MEDVPSGDYYCADCVEKIVQMNIDQIEEVDPTIDLDMID